MDPRAFCRCEIIPPPRTIAFTLRASPARGNARRDAHTTI